MAKITMVVALFRLSMLCEKRGETLIEDRDCSVCTIDSKIGTIIDPRNDAPDEPKDYIVGVGGVYLKNESAPGGSEPIYRVLV